MQHKSDITFEKFPAKKKKPAAYSEKEVRLKDRDNKRKQKHQSRNPIQDS